MAQKKVTLSAEAGARLEAITGSTGTLYKVRSYRPFGKHFADRSEAEMEYAREVNRCRDDPVCQKLAADGWT